MKGNQGRSNYFTAHLTAGVQSQIDYERLEAWWGPNPLKLLKCLAPVFLRTFPDQLVELNAALAERDTKTLRLIAHTVKSSCGSLGLMAIAEHCGVMERAIENDDLIEVAQRLEQVLILGDLVMDELAAL